MPKKSRHLCPQGPTEDDRFADCSFADDVDLLGGSEEKLKQLAERLKKTAAADCMEISSGKSKILVNSIKHRSSAYEVTI